MLPTLGDQQEVTRKDGEVERNQEALADALPYFVAVGLQVFGVGAELGSMSSVFGEVHRAAFDAFVFVSKRLGTGDQLGVFGCKRVPIIHDVILAGGFVNALMMRRRVNRSTSAAVPPPPTATVRTLRCTSSRSGFCEKVLTQADRVFRASIRCARSTHQALHWLSSDRDSRPYPLSQRRRSSRGERAEFRGNDPVRPGSPSPKSERPAGCPSDTARIPSTQSLACP